MIEYQECISINNSIKNKNSLVDVTAVIEFNLKQAASTEIKNKANIYYIFQNSPQIEEEQRLVINPGYLRIEGIGNKQNIVVTEYNEDIQRQNFSTNLVADNPDIIKISNQQIIAIRAGSTLLKVEKNGLSDSIRVDVKE